MKDKLSKDFYLMNNGSCRRVRINEKGEMDEHPYKWEDAKKCNHPGPHPHNFSGIGIFKEQS